MSIKYRPEIDGLRAIAVISVLFYHARFSVAGTPLLPGGFLGVDIFFVISGYLITLILLKEHAQASASYARFYMRRARRILPALFLVILATIPFAWQLMPPKALQEYSGSALSSLVFSSNIWFWMEDSYTAEASSVKPLLHTWSLSVEEQFYILFPVLLFTLLNYFRRHVISVFLGVFVISLLAAEISSRLYPDAAFYLVLMRFWEIIAGALLASLEFQGKKAQHPLCYKYLPGLGIILIVLSVALFNNDLRHPSIYTVIPIVGTCLFIRYAKTGNAVSDAMSYRGMVYIGLISYSLYLWHFPIFAFSRLQYGVLSNMDKGVIILASILLAIASYFFVEKPFRSRTFPAKYAVSILSVAFCAMIAIYANFYTTHGAVYRLTESGQQKFADFNAGEWEALKSETLGRHMESGDLTDTCSLRDPRDACEFGRRQWITLGDSFAAQYERALAEKVLPDGSGLMTLTYAQCPFVAPNMWFGDTKECAQINKLRWQIIRSLDKKHNFLISAHPMLLLTPKVARSQGDRIVPGTRKMSGDEAYASYIESINALLEMGHKVVLIHSVPRPKLDFRLSFFQHLRRDANDSAMAVRHIPNSVEAYERSKRFDSWIDIDDHPNLIKIFPRDILCAQGDEMLCLSMSAAGPIYNNNPHLSIHGTRKVIDEVFKFRDNLY